MILGGKALHPVLGELFGELERCWLSWLLLRVPANVAAPTGDVDLLVAGEDAGAVRAAALRAGFVALPGWEAPPNLILLRYDLPSNHWLVLDVVTELRFGSGRRLAGAAGVLRRRRVDGGVALPADPDAFWLLLAHCLLDRGTVAPRYRDALLELADAGSVSPLASDLPSWAPSALIDAVRREDWGGLDELGERLAAGLRLHRAGAVRARSPRLVAVARSARRRGFSFALLGPNGVGKSTVAARIGEGFPLESRVVHMGLWKTNDGSDPGLRAAITRPLRIWSRYLLARYHQLQGRLVIFDRYVYEAYLPAKPPLKALKRRYFWLLAHAVPRPAATVVLDVPGPVAFGRKGENLPDELEEERVVYRRLAETMSGVEVVDAARELDAVCADVTAILWRRLAERWAGPR